MFFQQVCLGSHLLQWVAEWEWIISENSSKNGLKGVIVKDKKDDLILTTASDVFALR